MFLQNDAELKKDSAEISVQPRDSVLNKIGSGSTKNAPRNKMLMWQPESMKYEFSFYFVKMIF